MNTPTWQLADHLLKGGVAKFIKTHRQQEKSYRQIALAMRDQTAGKVDVTPETVRNWDRERLGVSS